MINLKIDPEFQSQIPPLTDDEFKQLEENILKEGKLLSPLIVWNNTLVDGHNRYEIVQEHLCFRISSSTDTCVELVGARFLHLLTQTVPSLKSPTGAFIASQTLIFRRKQIIRTHLLSETSSDYFCLVRVARIELTAS